MLSTKVKFALAAVVLYCGTLKAQETTTLWGFPADTTTTTVPATTTTTPPAATTTTTTAAPTTTTTTTVPSTTTTTAAPSTTTSTAAPATTTTTAPSTTSTSTVADPVTTTSSKATTTTTPDDDKCKKCVRQVCNVKRFNKGTLKNVCVSAVAGDFSKWKKECDDKYPGEKSDDDFHKEKRKGIRACCGRGKDHKGKTHDKGYH